MRNIRLSVVCVFMLSLTTTLFGQESTVQRDVNVQHIPASAFASATMFPSELKTTKQLEAMPYEVVTAWSKREMGIDLMQAKQITAIVRTPESMAAMNQGPPMWAAIMHFDSKQTLGGTMMEWLEKDDQNGQVFIGNARVGIPSFLVIDDQTIVVGDPGWFTELQASGDDSNLGQLMKAGLSGSGDVFAVVDMKRARPLLSEMTQEIPNGVPPPIGKMRELPELLDSELISLNLKTGQLKNQMTAVDAEAAERTKKILMQAMSFGADMAIGTAATQMDTSDTVQMAGLEYFQRLSVIIQRDLEPQVAGKNVTVELKNANVAVVPVLVGMLLPAVQATRAAARRTVSMNNLRQMALASLNYESAHMHFPRQANYDDEGKPLLSWRVHILPFIEGNGLYEKFKLDEPWDSDHNKKLIKLMPDVYRSPMANVAEGKTVYLGVAGNGGIFGKKKVGFGQITDGSSNTALVVEVNEELAVEWTKPQDYECDPKNPLKGLGGLQPRGFIAAMADGSTHFLPSTMNPENWKWMTQMNDGNVVNW